MSDNIPFEIQMEIIKWLPVKPLIQFRSVSKPWKSFIDSPQFINGYGARHTQPHSRILRYKSQDELRYIRLVDDDVETFKVQQQEFAPFVMSPLLKQHRVLKVVGACHGLLCLFGNHRGYNKRMVVIWNPCIGKSIGIAVPRFTARIDVESVYGFGVCPVTSDPTVVKVLSPVNTPWHVEVFTLSSGVWNVLPSSNLPHESIKYMSSQVVINRFIYWGARHKVVSFDLITKELKVVGLPDSLTNELVTSIPVSIPVSVSKLRGSLVVSEYIGAEGVIGVWVMEHDSSFTKLFSFGTVFTNILGFRKNGETIFETLKEGERFRTLDLYDPCSQQIKNLGISGEYGSFFMCSYKESLLLLDHSDSHIYSNDS